MKIAVIGANGQIGRQLVTLLHQRDHHVRAMIRDPAQGAALEARGAHTMVADLEKDCGFVLEGCDAAVFTAGSGPHTGPEKTENVDRDGAMRIVDACLHHGIARFVMVSAMRTRQPEQAPETLRHYLRCKAQADEYLQKSSLQWTIAAPGRLNNDTPCGTIQAAETLAEVGEIPRADVAHVLAEMLALDHTIRRRIEFITGDTPIRDALQK